MQNSKVLLNTLALEPIYKDGGRGPIQYHKIKFDDNFEIKNKLPFDTKENVEINFLLWVDGIPPEKLVPLPSDYHSKDVKYGEESIEVLEVNSY